MSMPLLLLAQSIRRAQRLAIAMEVKSFSNESKRMYYYHIALASDTLSFRLSLA